MSDKITASVPRRHELDALRAFAMLLGIVLHAVLSLTGNPWLVRDSHPSKWLEWVNSGIHGFRMQLFIFISGYFTMMLWRRRGLAAMVDQRYQRVFIPCMLGLVSVLPLLHFVLSRERTPPQINNAPPTSAVKSPLVEAIRSGDLRKVNALLANGADPKEQDAEFGLTPLHWAAMYGDSTVAELLLDQGADTASKDRSGYTALHSAMFRGMPEVVEVLLRRGADPIARGGNNDTPRDSAKADWGATQFICGLLRIPLGKEADLIAGREKCNELLAVSEEALKPWFPNEWRLKVRKEYSELLRKQSLTIRFGPVPTNIFLTPQFDHLWFLWFLCWLVAIFAIGAWIVERVTLPRLPSWLSLSPFRFLWLIPMTMVSQVFMGVFSSEFGPDTSIGLIPQPHLLVYYGLFFFAGAFCQDHDGESSRLGRFWWLLLPLALGIALPAGKLIRTEPMLSGALQVTYAWAMTFGLIGLFRALLNSENRVIRYLSDSAYWLYVAHLPVVIELQHQVKEWDWSAVEKLAFICGVTTVSLLVTYQLLVRNFWLGRLLNGPRSKPSDKPKETPTS